MFVVISIPGALDGCFISLIFVFFQFSMKLLVLKLSVPKIKIFCGIGASVVFQVKVGHA